MKPRERSTMEVGERTFNYLRLSQSATSACLRFILNVVRLLPDRARGKIWFEGSDLDGEDMKVVAAYDTGVVVISVF